MIICRHAIDLSIIKSPTTKCRETYCFCSVSYNYYFFIIFFLLHELVRILPLSKWPPSKVETSTLSDFNENQFLGIFWCDEQCAAREETFCDLLAITTNMRLPLPKYERHSFQLRPVCKDILCLIPWCNWRKLTPPWCAVPEVRLNILS